MIAGSNMVRRARRPAWTRGARKAAPAHDADGPDLLTSLARRISDRAALVSRRRVNVEYSRPVRDCYRTAPNDRAWRADYRDRVLWCIADATSQRVLLEYILAGPGAATPTSVEQSIVAESICRLVDTDTNEERIVLREERALRPPQPSLWRSNVDIVDGSERRATLQLLLSVADPPAPPQASAMVEIARVPLRLGASLEPFRVRLSEVAAWTPGEIVALACTTPSLRVDIIAGATMLAHGRLGSAGVWRAVRLEHTYLAEAS
jgi:flagellar motor switch/type III secretory pathway protein FliN